MKLKKLQTSIVWVAYQYEQLGGALNICLSKELKGLMSMLGYAPGIDMSAIGLLAYEVFS